jgi:cell fate (sporulation/competence/biofilm development) regulator YlbF (YheA/YmcA/DUF963 family)
MDQVINAARSLGKIIQADGRYIRYAEAQKMQENDAELQEMISQFHQVRLSLNEEMGGPDKDQARIGELDSEMKTLYKDIFANPNMLELTEARTEMEELLTFVNQIVTGSGNGQNPETIEFSAGCGGSCSSCAGCG